MGIFDYVRLSKDLKKRLGKYGVRDYQTKYVLDGEYIGVYGAFDERAPAWRLLTWVELLVKPGPKSALMESLMQTVDIGDIGEVRKLRLEAILDACLYSDEVGDVLNSLGFEGPEEGEETYHTRVKEVVGRIALAGEEAVLRIGRVKDEQALFGYCIYLSIRSGEAELRVPLTVSLEVGGGEIVAIKEESLERRARTKTWRREHSKGGVKVTERVKVGESQYIASPYNLEVVAEAETEVEKVSEALIDRLNEIVKNTARRILLG